MSVYKRKVLLEQGWWVKKNFCLNQLIFLLQIDLEKVSKLSKMVLKKRKNLYLIKLLSKWKTRQLEKGIPAFCFFIFGIWSWCQLIQHEILLQVICLIFFKNVSVVPKKVARFVIQLNFVWNVLCNLSLQNWKMFEWKCFHKFTKCWQILILTLWFVTVPCLLAKIPQS